MTAATTEVDYIVQMEANSQQTESTCSAWENGLGGCEVLNFMSTVDSRQDQQASQAGSIARRNAKFTPQIDYGGEHGAAAEGRHCIYWANVGGGRWVLDDDLSISNGVLGVTSEVAPELAYVAFGPHSHARNGLRDADVVCGDKGSCEVGSTPSTAPTSRWLLDSPRLQTWVAVESVNVVCDIAA